MQTVELQFLLCNLIHKNYLFMEYEQGIQEKSFWLKMFEARKKAIKICYKVSI